MKHPHLPDHRPLRAPALAAALAVSLVLARPARSESAPTEPLPTPNVAQITPAPQAAEDLIRRARPLPGDSASTQPASLGDAARPASPLFEFARVAVALGLVLAAVFGLKYIAGKLLGIRPVGVNANRGVRVLSRTLTGPKQQLVLVQVGRRLVLLSDSAGNVTPVCEVSDPDEVAELAAQALPAEAAAFRRLLAGRTSDAASPVPADVDDTAPLERDTAASDHVPGLEGLADRIRRLRDHFGSAAAS